MKNTLHTPGPWQIKKIYAPFNDPTGTKQARYFSIEQKSETRHTLPAYLVAPCEIYPLGEKPIKNKEGEANARLISSAPDLLDALDWALRQIEDDLDPDHQAAFDAACSSLAKAKGVIE
jgi:hypothetical protein